METRSQSHPIGVPRSGAYHSGLWVFYPIGGVAGGATVIFLLAALVSLIVTVLQSNGSSSIRFMQDVWLVVLFKLHAGFAGVNITMLHGLNFLDLLFLVMAGGMALGLYTAFKGASPVWSLLGAIQPFLGIVLFLATREAGRSSVMGSVLVLSIVMLRSPLFSKGSAILGILGSVLLLIGDFSAGVVPPSNLMATLMAIGYGALMIWCFLMATKLFRLGVADRTGKTQ